MAWCCKVSASLLRACSCAVSAFVVPSSSRRRISSELTSPAEAAASVDGWRKGAGCCNQLAPSGYSARRWLHAGAWYGASAGADGGTVVRESHTHAYQQSKTMFHVALGQACTRDQLTRQRVSTIQLHHHCARCRSSNSSQHLSFTATLLPLQGVALSTQCSYV